MGDHAKRAGLGGKAWTIGSHTNRARQKEETRRRILDAASELFGARGFHETKVSHIATAAKVSPGSVYAHFGSPGQIMAELHANLVVSRTRKLTAMRQAWPKTGSAWDLLLAMLSEVWGMNKTTLQMENVAAFHSWLWVCPAEAFQPLRQTYADLFEELGKTVRLAQGEGTVPGEVDVDDMVELMAVAFFAGIQEARISPEAYAKQHEVFLSRVHKIFRVDNRQA